MATAVSICNMALSLVGSANVITTLDGVGSEENRQCFLHYEPTRDALLRSHPWNFAIKRTVLVTPAETAKTITGATAANPVVISVASHGYSTGDRVRIASVGGMTSINNREFTIESLTSGTFSLLDENGTAYTAYTSGGTATKIPAFDYSYWFTLPTGCLRVIRVNGDEYNYKTEAGRLLFNSDEAELIYVKQVTDPAEFDSQFVQLLSLALAVKIAVKLSDNANLKESLKADLRDMLREARTFDAQEGGKPDDIFASTWLMARY